MYPDPFYNTGAQFSPMWIPMPPGFSPMPFSGQFNTPDSMNNNPYPPQAFVPPPPDFSGFYPWQ